MKSARLLAAVLIATAGFVLGLQAQGDPSDVAKADINDDLIVDNADLALVKSAYGKRLGQFGYLPLADMDDNNMITVADLSFVQRYLGRTVPVPPAIHINEIESNGGDPGDWIELINVGSKPANLSGWSIRDNDDTHTYVLPAGTTIAAGGSLVLDEETFDFGLGSADSVRLFDESGALFES